MTQPLIKFLLLAALAVVGYYAVRGSRRAIHRVVWRGLVLLAVVAGAISVVSPGVLNWVANKLGVGRGADLVLYGVTVAFMLVSVILFRRVADLERRYVALARAIAIRDAGDDQTVKPDVTEEADRDLGERR
jgi:hypothetical protein